MGWSGVTRKDLSRTSKMGPFELGFRSLVENSIPSPFLHLKNSSYCLIQGTKFRSAVGAFFLGKLDFFLHFFQKKFPGCRAFLKIYLRSSLLCLFCRQNTLPGSLWHRQPHNSEIPDSLSLSDTDVSSYHCLTARSNTTQLRMPRVSSSDRKGRMPLRVLGLG